MRFKILLALEIPSLICYLVVIIYIMTQKTLRSGLNYHSLLILLLLNLVVVAIDFSMYLAFFQRGIVPFKNPVYCLIWDFIDNAVWVMGEYMMAWASFERHILIFHERLLRSKWRKICFHYAPPFILLFYVTCFYIYAFFIYPCENSYDYQSTNCAAPCYLNYEIISVSDMIVDFLIPPIMDSIFSITLFIRILYSKHRLRRSVGWRKYGKMAFQLIFISFLFLVTNAPYAIIDALLFFDSSHSVQVAYDFSFSITYLYPLCLPFLCLAWMPQIWGSIKERIHPSTTRQTAPMNWKNRFLL